MRAFTSSAPSSARSHGAASRTAAGQGRRGLHLKCAAAGGSTTTTVPVRVLLKIPYRVNFGQTVAVVGSGDLLGHWEPTKAVRMSWTAGDFWEAEISVEPGSATQLEYKYVVLNSNGTVSHWKPGQNYKLDVLASRGTRVLVTETWDDGPRHVEVDMENADPPAAGATASPASAPAQAASAPAPEAAAQQQQSQQHGSSNGKASSNGKKAASANGAEASARRAEQQAGAPPPSSSVPTAQEARPSPLTATSALPLSGTAIIQQEAQAAMSELKDALDRQVITLQRVTDPTAIEVLIGDRLLAAANSKAVALNRAVRAAEALPMLPPGADVTARNASPPPPPSQAKEQQAAGKNGSKRS